MAVTVRSIMDWDHYECINCGHEEAFGEWQRKAFIIPRTWLEDDLEIK